MEKKDAVRIVEDDVDKHAFFEGIRSKIKNNSFMQKLLINAHAVDKVALTSPLNAKDSENFSSKDQL